MLPNYNGSLRIRILDLTFEPHWQHPQDYIVRFMNAGQIADLIPDIIMKETVWMELMSESLQVMITNRHADSVELGYADVKLTQLIKYQETVHKIHVHMAIRDRNRGWLERQAGTIVIQLLYSAKPINGVITILIMDAQLTRDTEIMTKMDPYVIIKYAGKEFKTKVMSEAGKTPVWNQSFQFPVTRFNEKIQLIVMDDDVTKDDEVGRTQFILRELGLINREENQRTLQLVYFKSKDNPVPAGVIRIHTQFSF